MAPRLPEQELFVEQVMSSWRADGGEPDVGLALPEYLVEAGFELEVTRLHVEVIAPGDPLWQWPRSYLQVGARRLVELGLMTAPQADDLARALDKVERLAHARMVTPLVIEVIARAGD
jgi:hypothetical protein